MSDDWLLFAALKFGHMEKPESGIRNPEPEMEPEPEAGPELKLRPN